MLNNRQAGRRRGRGGQRQQGNGGRSPEQGNRIDNRARGNAPQMLEKYKTLARDAQMAGDRVMTEYYLQFADHYFRVVAETRARFEEQRRQRGDYQDDDDGYESEERNDSEDQEGEDSEGDFAEPRRPQREYGREQQGRNDGRDQGREQGRDQNQNQNQNQNRNRDQQPRPPREFRPRDESRPREEPRAREEAAPRTEDREARPRRPREDRYDRDNRNGNARAEREDIPATIDVAVLPPSFGSDGPVSPMADLPLGLEGEIDDAPAAAPKRRGRPRKVVADADAG